MFSVAFAAALIASPWDVAYHPVAPPSFAQCFEHDPPMPALAHAPPRSSERRRRADPPDRNERIARGVVGASLIVAGTALSAGTRLTGYAPWVFTEPSEPGRPPRVGVSTANTSRSAVVTGVAGTVLNALGVGQLRRAVRGR